MEVAEILDQWNLALPVGTSESGDCFQFCTLGQVCESPERHRPSNSKNRNKLRSEVIITPTEAGLSRVARNFTYSTKSAKDSLVRSHLLLALNSRTN